MAHEDITVASTTDEMEDVEAAAEVTREELETGRLPEPLNREEEPEEESKDNRPSGKAGFQKRIDKLTRDKYESQEKIRELEARLREVETTAHRGGGEPNGMDQPAAPEKPSPPMPRAEEREGPPSDRTPEREAAARQARETHVRFARDYDAALPKGSPERVELEKAAAQTEKEVGGIHPTVAQMVMAMPNSVDTYAWLCHHPDDLRTLNASRSPAEALANVRYISGVLRGMVQAKAASPKSLSVKQPPEPVRHVRGSSSSTTVDLADADYQTYRRIRERQEKNRYR